MLICVPPGFSAEAWEVVKRKPNARIADVSAGNRQMGPIKNLDNVIFIDKEPLLKIKPDLLADWKTLDRHFPKDYFHCLIWDPPHIFSRTSQFNKTPWLTSNGSLNQPGWYGAFNGKRDAAIQLYWGQKSMAEISPRLCFKWNEAQESVEWALSLLDYWQVQFKVRYVSPFRKNSQVKAWIWWIKLVRRGRNDD
jgi:hypothetical protein